MFNGDQKKWSLWLSDAAQAFLQGKQDQSERSGPLYMLSPRDPLQIQAGSFPAELYEVTGNGYGLSNAPHVWYTKVTQELMDNDFLVHSFDKCFF